MAKIHLFIMDMFVIIITFKIIIINLRSLNYYQQTEHNNFMYKLYIIMIIDVDIDVATKVH